MKSKSKYRNLNSKQRRRIRTKVCRRDNYICQYCGADLLSSPTLFYYRTVDHIQPTGKGGSPINVNNMVCCCNICNNLKSDYVAKSVEDARRYIENRRIEFDLYYASEKKRYRTSWLRKILTWFW